MKLIIDFLDETEEVEQSLLNDLEGLLQLAADLEGVPDQTELSVTFVKNERIQEINKEYRGKDQPTDVISFAMEEMGEGEMEIIGDHLPKHLGDLIISTEQAVLQAEEYGHSYMRELGFLTVHGFLHLLGYDHMNEEDEKEMFTRQEEILKVYGLVR
ncbi:putative rRNA maturation factor [Bacillus mesophilus]|uniref:Endoribonuclease YbeY n=1 Tax=Bacillus mesophilus TaxID=1808955 RepID=A0A6M0Q5M9_9BACI|nr:rRNA maturation RNase YbeY [Bacillus mesophilus]MBM7660796.1 putative rRNA maturation factor [Bacillus mesophilus]NEY71657.1 rRNA maturation RNase YbeY [Bacillus mesophilus]